MIETREQWEEIKQDVKSNISTQHEKRLVELIEALRGVARAANRTNIQLKGSPHSPLAKALATLPDWVFDG